MPTDHRTTLAGIKRFDQLIAYLRDEMNWPIDRDSFEDVSDLFYPYSAEELGLDKDTAVNIAEIKRLRPLSAKQPWDIFFVKFEPKRLPVVALRRILSRVSLKKRPSAGVAEHAAWDPNDLLFVSNYGDDNHRQISLAHFSRPADSRDLPTLKVLGWDSKDTPLHLDAVARELTTQLAWPEDESDAAAWRAQWSAAFSLGHREAVSTARDLALHLSRLARSIKDRIETALAIETDKGPLTRLMESFRTSLVHDLDASAFADMYAQTISYGLLSARIADPTRKSVDDLAKHMRTSPFLRELMETFLRVGGRKGQADGAGLDFDELGITEVTELLDAANMEAVIRDFGDRNRDEDPVIHFYEHFLTAYNRQLKIQRGVFYTPQPVVSYIVRSVHEMLQTEFGLADGLADTTTWGEMLKKHPGLQLPPLTDEPGEKRTISPDEPFVQILDPATGTATFLVEVIDVIHRTLAAKWKQQRLTDAQQRAAWNDYVPQHLLPRLHAFELMMAPYAIAHMKVGLKLAETGYRFGTEERARIYLTNALEPWAKQLPLIGIDALAHEAAAVNELKHHKRFTVIIGNPPYSNFGMLNKGPFILRLLEDYKRGLNERKINLDDDFIKFLRLSQWLIQQSQSGVVAVITSNTFLDGITHRQMRNSLMGTFDAVTTCDLHGNSRKREATPSGKVDENVFDIQQGVAITTFARHLNTSKTASVSYHELWGLREHKYEALLNKSDEMPRPQAISPHGPNWFFVPKNYSYLAEYEGYLAINKVFLGFSSGVQTKRDALTIQFSSEDLDRIKRDLLCLPIETIRTKYELPEDGRDWTIPGAKADLVENNPIVIDITYRPFDVRKTLWTGKSKGFLGYPRAETMVHMLMPNIGMNIKRQMQDLNWSYASVTRNVVESAVHFSTPSNPHFFPLYFYDNINDSRQLLIRNEAGRCRRHNLSSTIVHGTSREIQLGFVEEGQGDLERTFGPEDVFSYIYAVFHSPSYRARYAEFLKIDFPRVPIAGTIGLFRSLARLGGELTTLHLLESPQLDQHITTFVGEPNVDITKVGWTPDENGTVWVDAKGTRDETRPGSVGFKGVSAAVWNFHIGGYQVCEKWLKDRKGRTLSKDDITHYHKIVVALSETIRLMQEIDDVIKQHGGWPGAFASSSGTNTSAGQNDPEASSSPSPVQTVLAEPSEHKPLDISVYTSTSSLFADGGIDTDEGASSARTGPNVGGVEKDRIICLIRDVLESSHEIERDALIRDVARGLGFQRAGSRIAEAIDDAIRTAVRRDIASSSAGRIRLYARHITDYDRDQLKHQFLASLGQTWSERDDAIRSFARWMGFQRAGPKIDETTRSIINGLIREDRLESDGARIRRLAR